MIASTRLAVRPVNHFAGAASKADTLCASKREKDSEKHLANCGWHPAVPKHVLDVYVRVTSEVLSRSTANRQGGHTEEPNNPGPQSGKY
jgi:hypothetical protein